LKAETPFSVFRCC